MFPKLNKKNQKAVLNHEVCHLESFSSRSLQQDHETWVMTKLQSFKYSLDLHITMNQILFC